MKQISRSIGVVLIFLWSIFVIAQEEETNVDVTVTGSAIVSPLIEILATEHTADVNYTAEIIGSTEGFSQLCSGDATITMATRTMTIAESAACRDAGINYMELLLGYHILAIGTNQSADYAQCLTLTQLDTLFAPSSANLVTNWDFMKQNTEQEEGQELPDIVLHLPDTRSLGYMLLDDLVSGIGLRGDAIITSNTDDRIEEIQATNGAIGVISGLSAMQNENLSVAAIDFGSGCQQPTVEAVEKSDYLAAMPLFIFANRDTLDDKTKSFLEFISSPASSDAIMRAGFSTPSTESYDLNADILLGVQESRGFETDSIEFEMPASVAGIIRVGGSAMGSSLVSTTNDRLSGQYPEMNITESFLGTSAGHDSFCAKELDLFFSTSRNTAACETEDILFEAIGLGSQAVVLVSNLEDNYAACLTTDQITAIWGASSTDTILNWNQVGASMPDQAFTLFGIREGNTLTDIMLGTQPVRVDTEIDFNPLYRAAAVANVAGSLTYMSWVDYQEVLDHEQENIQLVLVDGGEGCILPTEETISNGTYPLSIPMSLILNKLSLTHEVVQSFVWTMFLDENYSIFSAKDVVGLERADLATIRGELLLMFEEAKSIPVPEEETETEATEEATSD